MVLHRDHDMKYFNADNLEWAELSGRMYRDYVKDIIATSRSISDITNAGRLYLKVVPAPYCPEVYFNWKANAKSWR